MIPKFSGKYRFLSNFSLCPIKYGGLTYPSVEHAYQAMKCKNEKERDFFCSGISSGDAKRLGQKVEVREDWDKVKLGIMLDLLRIKFHKDTAFAKFLLETNDEELIEGNWWGDVYWGQCPVGTGENHLGKLLMQVRSELEQAE